ncbi:AraC family transcriptional regulator [Paenibacillus sp. UNC499MF]|uniref:AraC family transcriptional regulator n=1 Tax=Paenibacillus sp. UNC499MF TaxID=1502751 RepID=UPI0008A08AF3|nr:AraC family transcriptional regulator [Paenibacillus sp. UNC499MF]SEG46750.1 ABC-type Fe3+-hydroxamate transport system, substrate-binding protein [Paenibacillus sp. UNC499MF]
MSDIPTTGENIRPDLALSAANASYKLRQVEIIKAGESWEMDYRLIDTHMLIAVTAGEGTLKRDGALSRLGDNNVHICLPGQVIGMKAEGSGLELTLAGFDLFYEDETGESLEKGTWRGPQVLNVQPLPQLPVLSGALHTFWHGSDPLDRLKAEAGFLDLFHAICSYTRDESRQDARSALERTRHYIENNYQTNITIDELARMAEVSPKYYGDLFKKTYGLSVIDYLTEQRVNRAKQLMALSQSRLKDIAHVVGYQDEFYFSRKFKQEVGVSPTVYMKNRRKKIAVHQSHLIGQLLAIHHLPYAAPLHPKWTGHYYERYRSDIPVHLSAYRYSEDWEHNIEKLRETRPDLIISMDTLNPGEKERLEQAGKVLYIPERQLDWREQLLLIAAYLDRTAEAQAWLDKFDGRVESLRSRLRKRAGEETFLLISLHKQEIRVCGTRSMGDVFFHELGMKPAFEYVRDRINVPIHPEQLAELAADHLLVNVCQESETLRRWRDLQATALWRDLKAVRMNRVYEIPSDPWREYSASGHERILDEVEKLFLRK